MCIVQKCRKYYRLYLIVAVLTACSVIFIYQFFILDSLFSSPMTEDDLRSLNLTLSTLLSELDRLNVTYFMTHGTLLERYADVTVIKRVLFMRSWPQTAVACIRLQQCSCSRSCIAVHGQLSDHYFRSVCLFFCVCLFACAEFFSAVFDPIWIKLGYMLYVWV